MEQRGGTGAAPMEFTNSLGTPLNDALNFVHNALIATGLRSKIKIIASGKVIDSFNLVSKFSLGADLCNSARGMMFAVGCIQALRCNSNNCPAGVATQDPKLYRLVDVEDKSKRVARYHNKTMDELKHLLCAAGFSRVQDIKKSHIKRRIGPGKIMNYSKIYPEMAENSLIDGTYQGDWLDDWQQATSQRF